MSPTCSGQKVWIFLIFQNCFRTRICSVVRTHLTLSWSKIIVQSWSEIDMTGHLEIFDHLSFHGDPDQVGLTRIQVLEVVTLAPCTTLLERSLLPSSFLIILLNELKSLAPQGPTR